MARTETTMWKVGRGDYLLVTLGVWAVMLVGTVALVAPTLAAWAGGEPLTVTSQAESVGPAVPELRPLPGATVTYSTDVVWTLARATPGQWLLSLVPGLITAAALLVGGLAVLHAIGNARAGRPFARSSVRDLRVLGLAVVGYAVLVPVVGLLVRFVLVAGANADVALSVHLEPLPVAIFVVGLLVILLADVFGRGARLQDDVEGLV